MRFRRQARRRDHSYCVYCKHARKRHWRKSLDCREHGCDCPLFQPSVIKLQS